MPLRLGSEPDSLEVLLPANGDFIETLETLTPDMTGPQPWPLGTQISLVFGEGAGQVVWFATIDTNLLSWVVQSHEVNAVIDAGLKRVALWYENGTIRYPLAIGDVAVYG